MQDPLRPLQNDALVRFHRCVPTEKPQVTQAERENKDDDSSFCGRIFWKADSQTGTVSQSRAESVGLGQNFTFDPSSQRILSLPDWLSQPGHF